MPRRATYKCPICNSKNTVRIAYGYPGPEAVEDSKAGKVHLGGCTIDVFNQNNKHIISDSALAITLTDKWCAQIGCKLIVAYIPNSAFWRPDSLANKYREELRKFTKSEGIMFLDMTHHFDHNKGSDDFSIKGQHYSPIGYKKIATELFNFASLARE